MMRRLAIVTVLVGALAAGGAAVALTRGGTSVVTGVAAVPAVPAVTGQDVSSVRPSTGNGTTAPQTRGARGGFGGEAGVGRGFGKGYGFGFGRGRGVLTVTGVSGNTINATIGRNRIGSSRAVTVTVSATTAYTEAGASASLSDVQKGSLIAVKGTVTAPNTIQATAVVIVLPQEAGVVTGVSGNTITLTGFDGSTHKVTVGPTTRYQRAGTSAALSDIATGTAIVAEGTLNSDGSLNAVRITIQVQRIAGQVTGVNGTSYTVAGRFGTSYTVNATGSTTYLNANGSTASASAVKTGVYILAQGTLSSDGKTLSALRILIVPGGAGRGFGFGYGGHGRHGGWGFGPAAGNGGTFGPSQNLPAAPGSGTASSV